MNVLATLKRELGLAETASVLDVRKAFTDLLLAECSDAERAALAEPGDEDAARPDPWVEFLRAMGMPEDTTVEAMVQHLRKQMAPEEEEEKKEQVMSENAKLQLELRELRDRVAALEPKAAMAERLEVEARKTERDLFFSEQVRLGKMAPVDRAFYEQMWAKDEQAVREFFTKKRPGSAVKTIEVGTDLPGAPPDDRDARVILSERAAQLAREKGITFTEALGQLKAQDPDLVAEVATYYGPAGLARR